MIKISPSVLACDFSHMAEEAQKVEAAGCKYLHLDVMDGMFVPNISFGAPVITCLRDKTKAVFDVHLMIMDPMRYIDDFKKAGADIITIHYESCDNYVEVLKYIRSIGCKAGIVIKPGTPASVLDELIDLVDLILIMTVEPGFGGQKLIPECVEKVKYAAELIKKSGRDIDLEVDGGVTPENVGMVKEAGANVIVAGSAIFRAKDMTAAVNAMMA